MASGQRTVWRVGDLVFKALDSSPHMVAWQAVVLARVGPDAGVRVAPPVPTPSGTWVVQGWTAWRFVAGKPVGRDWRMIMVAGQALHRALRDESRPRLVDERDDVWARADRMVWDMAAAAPHPQLTAAFASRHPVDLPDQLVHGDLTGNVLVDEDNAPAVIDFSPYWRPVQWATAVVCADAMLFEHADADTVLAAARTATGAIPGGQLLLRAVLFRLVTDALLGRTPGADLRHLDVLRQVVQLSAGQ